MISVTISAVDGGIRLKQRKGGRFNMRGPAYMVVNHHKAYLPWESAAARW